MNLGPLQMHLERSARARPTRPTRPASGSHRRPTGLAMATSVVVALVTTFGTAFVPAGAATTATVVGSLAVAVRSVNVTPTSFTIGNCTLDGTPNLLQFPNDQCSAGAFTITNGTAPAHIDEKLSLFTPTDNGQAWGPCGASGNSACAGTSGAPGRNQFTWTSNWGQVFGTGNQCDQHATPAVSPCPMTGPAAVATDQYTLTGPTSATDLSSSFTITLTWSAVP